MVTLYGSFFFFFTIHAVIIPYLQVIVRNLGYSYEAVGALLSLYEAAGIIGPLLIAHYIDRSGRMRSTILLTTVLSIVSLSLLVRSSSLAGTIITLILLALFYRPIIPALDSYANNRFDGNSRSYSAVRAVGSGGYVALSLFFGLSGNPRIESNRNIASWAIGMALFFILTTFFWPKDTSVRLFKESTSSAEQGRWFDRAFIPGLILIGLNSFVFSALHNFFSLYLVEELAITNIGLMNAISAGSEIIAMIYAGYLLERKKVLPVHLIGISSLALALRYFLYAITPSFGWIIFGQLLNSLCYGFFQPAAIYFIARRVKRSRRTLGMSIFTSVGMGVPAVIGSLIGGMIIQHFGYATLFGSYALVALFSFFLSRVFSPIMRTPPLEEG